MARSLFGQTTPASLGDIATQEFSAKIFDRARRAGIASAIATMTTGFGNREIRVTVKLVALTDGANSGFSLILEDVTDRRALERALPATGLPVPAPATVEDSPPPQPGTVSDLRQAVEAATERSSAKTTPPTSAASDVAPEQPPANAAAPTPSGSPGSRTDTPAAKKREPT